MTAQGSGGGLPPCTVFLASLDTDNAYFEECKILVNVLPFSTEAEQWAAVVNRDRSADGLFYYSVRTSGIYCRPSCPSRQALRENVEFHQNSGAAEIAGFRACMRCQPDSVG